MNLILWNTKLLFIHLNKYTDVYANFCFYVWFLCIYHKGISIRFNPVDSSLRI